jgi:hypothetical protein
MPDLVPGIHVFFSFEERGKDVDGRDKPAMTENPGNFYECI